MIGIRFFRKGEGGRSRSRRHLLFFFLKIFGVCMSVSVSLSVSLSLSLSLSVSVSISSLLFLACLLAHPPFPPPRTHARRYLSSL
jgi:hypothetical protein